MPLCRPCEPRSELWIVSLELKPLMVAEGFPPPPHSLTPKSAQREMEAFFSATLPESPCLPLAVHSWEAGGG